MTGHFLIELFVIAIAVPAITQDPDDILDRARRQEEQQEAIVKRLIVVASNENEVPSKRQAALELLGTMHSRSAITGLLDNLMVEAGAISEFHALAKYPAAASLKKIGSAAIPQMWESLNRKREDRYLFLLAHTIYRIDGKPLAIARLREFLASPEPTDQQRTNIEKLLKTIEEVDLKDSKNWP
ncbi:MAG: hypothetical protein L0Z53_23205 [Acidobacteriales bacterium]|nr:hypothetical protein [Terriglobales bacterium]